MVKKINEKNGNGYDIKVTKEIEVMDKRGHHIYLSFSPENTWKYGDGVRLELCDSCRSLFDSLKQYCNVDDKYTKIFYRKPDGEFYGEYDEHECMLCGKTNGNTYYQMYFTTIK